MSRRSQWAHPAAGRRALSVLSAISLVVATLIAPSNAQAVGHREPRSGSSRTKTAPYVKPFRGTARHVRGKDEYVPPTTPLRQLAKQQRRAAKDAHRLARHYRRTGHLRPQGTTPSSSGTRHGRSSHAARKTAGRRRSSVNPDFAQHGQVPAGDIDTVFDGWLGIDPGITPNSVAATSEGGVYVVTDNADVSKLDGSSLTNITTAPSGSDWRLLGLSSETHMFLEGFGTDGVDRVAGLAHNDTQVGCNTGATPSGMVVSRNGTGYALVDGYGLCVIDPDGTVAYQGDVGPVGAGLGHAAGLALDGSGNLWTIGYTTETDSGGQTVYASMSLEEILKDGEFRVVDSNLPVPVDRPATSTYRGIDLTVDTAGDVFFSVGDFRIYERTPDGTITTIAGDGVPISFDGRNGDGGPASESRVDPGRLALDTDGNLLLTLDVDTSTNGGDVREIGAASSYSGAFPWAGPNANLFPANGIGPSESVGGGSNPSEITASAQRQATNYPVDTATGAFWHSFTDMIFAGRGPSLNVTRTYDSSVAGGDGLFGYGWSSLLTMGVTVDVLDSTWDVSQEDGSVVAFTGLEDGFFPVQPRMLATLVKNEDGTYTFTRRGREIFTFDNLGRLTQVADLNGNTLTLHYTDGNLDQVLSSNGRYLAITTVNGHIRFISDGYRSTQYDYYDNGDLEDASDADGGTWTYSYDDQHRLETMGSPNETDSGVIAQGHAQAMDDPTPVPLVNKYDDDTGRVQWQTDFLGRRTDFDYSSIPGATKVTDPSGRVTVDWYNDGLLSKTTKAYGQSGSATTQYLRYDPDFLAPTEIEDPRLNHWQYSYDSNGFPASSIDPLGNTRTFSYDSMGDLLTENDPAADVDTTNQYDADGNLQWTKTPLLDNNGTQIATQETDYSYDDPSNPGLPTSITSPNRAITHLTYNSFGDLASKTTPPTAAAPDGAETTWFYDPNSGRPDYSISPRGNLSGDLVDFKTDYDYDKDFQLLEVLDPLYDDAQPTAHRIEREYDDDGNLTKAIDGNNNTTTYKYDADDELTLITRPDTTTISQTWTESGKLWTRTNNALGQTTTYGYNTRDAVNSVTDPMNQVTKYVRDLNDNITSVAQPGASCSGAPTPGCVTRTYDTANELSGVTYHDGSTPNVTNMNYDADGRLRSETDGTGTSSWTYDSLGRLTDTTNGSGAHTSYDHDLDGNTIEIDYPGGPTVTRHFDAADELDWLNDGLGNVTNFGYDADGNQASTTFPTMTGDVDTYSYYDNDALQQITDTQGTTTLASFNYGRDGASQLQTSTTTGLTEPDQTYRYNGLEQLTSSGSASTPTPYLYDAAGNITTYGQNATTSATQTYKANSQLCWSTTATVTSPTCANPPLGAVTYDYDNAGNRTQASTPGPGTVSLDVRVSNDASTGSSVTSPTFTTSGPDTLLALVSADGTSGQTANVTGAGLTWTLVARANGKGGTAEVWTAQASQALTNQTVTATETQTSNPMSISVVAAAGGAGIGASTHGSATTGPASLTLTSTSAGSMTFAAGQDPDSATAPAVGSGQTRMHVFGTGAGTEKWAQRTTNASTAAGQTITMADTAPAADRWDMAAAEVVPTTVQTNVTAYTYDDANDLTSVDPPSSAADTFIYNAAGLRTSEAGNITATFTWDDRTTNALLLSDGSKSYIYGPGDLPIEQINSSGLTRWYHHDQLGNTRLLTGNVGTALASYNYTAYGVASYSGTASTPLQYGRGYTDSDTGLIYLQQRYFDPGTAQFLSVDPAVLTTNQPYEYTGASPVNGVDPNGSTWWNPSTWSAGTWINVVTTAIALVTAIPTGGGSLAADAEVLADEEAVSAAVGSGIGAAETAGDGSNVVFRGLAEGEDPAVGLTARAPGADVSPISHVAGKVASPWISTTKSLELAAGKYGKFGVVGIDLSKVGTEVVDVSGGFKGVPGMLSNFARHDQEVLIRDFVPPEAIFFP